MERPNLIWPLTLLIAFAALVALLMIGALPLPTAAVGNCDSPAYTTPAARERCIGTATAVAVAKKQTEAAAAYPSRTATTQAAPPPPGPAATSTSTITPTLALSPTALTAGPTASPTATPTVTATRAPQGSPSPTATSVLAGLETLVCVPGGNVTVTGRGTAGEALLVYFNERPVGGSLVRPDGLYTLTLRIGSERPGLYSVEIRERDSLELVRTLACEVPGATPTPTEEVVP